MQGMIREGRHDPRFPKKIAGIVTNPVIPTYCASLHNSQNKAVSLVHFAHNAGNYFSLSPCIPLPNMVYYLRTKRGADGKGELRVVFLNGFDGRQ